MQKTLSLILFIFWLVLIFCLSHQPGKESAETSLFLVNIVLYFTNLVNLTIDVEILSFLIRKTAHFFLYFILGILTLNVIIQYQIYQNHKKQITLAILFCIFYAITDEIHQIFVPGRSGEIIDVLIDSLGSISGIYLWLKVLKLR